MNLAEELAKIIYDNVVVGSTPEGIELHFVEQAVEEQVKLISTRLDSKARGIIKEVFEPPYYMAKFEQELDGCIAALKAELK